MIRYILILLFCSLGYGQGIVNNPYVTFGVSCTADPNERNTTTGATSDPNCNESNAIGGFLQSGTVTRSVESTDVNVGDYALKIVAGAGSNEIVYFPITAAINDTFDVSFDSKQTVGTVALFYVTGATPNGVLEIPLTWGSHSFSITATSTNVQLRFFPARDSGAGNIGDTVLVDNFSVVKTN